MSHSLSNAPHARNWRDIPQPVKPRAMSRGGRRRLAVAGLRVVGVTVVGIGLAWGAWEMAGVLQENPRTMPAAAKAVAVRTFELTTDGVLDKSWLVGALALPRNASLMELDLLQLRARLLTNGQVAAASVTRHPPDALSVRVAERSPVVRVMAQAGGGEPRALLVARDGVVFDGVGFEGATLAALPWLDGVKLVRHGAAFLPIEGMDAAAELLTKARLEADHLSATWQVVSLARLKSDDEIEVRTKSGLVLVFRAGEDVFPQLAKLSYMAEALANLPTPPAKIDLSLGREVPVTFDQPAAGAADRGIGLLKSSPTPAPLPGLSIFPRSPSKTKREL